MRPASVALLAALLGGVAAAPPATDATDAVELPGWGPRGDALRPETRARVLEEAGYALGRAPRPVARLGSAGSDDPKDDDVVASRAAFVDADDAVLLALAWRATDDARYRDAACERLVAWARDNEPTGHPIDETRLDALVNTYGLVGASLSADDDDAVRRWLTTMRDRKRAWAFGERGQKNNHRTHQLKMLLLLDRALGDQAGLAADRAAAEAHARANLDPDTGESVDLVERDALYYHAYNLDAWLEIVLQTRCCVAPVTAAWRLLEARLREGRVGGEFVGSTASLDAERGRAGFGYGAPGSIFDPARAEHALLAFLTVDPSATSLPPPSAATVQRRNLYTLARYESWTR